MLFFSTMLACTTPPAEPPAAQRHGPELRAHMQEHLADVVASRNALVKGDLAANKAAIQAFLDHGVARDLPGDWFARVTAMGEAAQAIRDAEDLRFASLATAQLAETCSACHTAVSARIELASPSAPDASASHAARADWAIDQLWLSLVLPSEERWDAAVAVLRQPSEDALLEDLDSAPGRAWRALQDPLAGPAPVMPRRVALAAEVLTGCGSCHRAVAAPE